MAKLSIIICCRDNELTMEAACKSCTWADELIVVDSGSKDRTLEIARKFTDRIVVEPWRGHSKQKRFAADLAKNDWIFFVDSDEECSPELAAELQKMSDAELERYDLLLVPRKTWVFERMVRAWQPDFVTRIFHRKRVTWNEHVLHDAREASDPSREGKVRNVVFHKRVSRDGFKDYFSGARLDSRALPVAYQMYERGKRAHWWDLLLRPYGAFLKFYILKRGFLDGTFGLIIAQKAAQGVQLKYAALWAVQNHVDGADPEAQKIAR